MKAIFNAYLFNPVFWHIWEALHNPNIRKIMVRGGSSAGKTFSICDVINLRQLTGICNAMAIRKERSNVDTTIKAAFETSINRLNGLSQYYTKMESEIRVATGSETHYAGMDDPEKIKGIESFDILYFNELNQFAEAEWTEAERRLRGRPNQKLIADWNPILKTHWINDEILNESEGWIDLPLDIPEYEEAYGAYTSLAEGYGFKRINAAGDTLWINVTYRDNFWIVGHPGNNIPAVPGAVCYQNGNPSQPVKLTENMFVAPDGNLYGFIDTHTIANFEKMKIKKPNDYRIYGLGEDGLMRTGGEMWVSFDEEKHSRDLTLEPDTLLWISADTNNMPYSALALWQVVPVEQESPLPDYKELRQIGEVVCRPPESSALKAAIKLDKYLKQIGYIGHLAICGDPSGKNKSTVDDNNRSFFDKLLSTLETLGWKTINYIAKAHPAIVLSKDFVNDIYEELIPGWRIVIGSSCRVSLEDYNLVKQDADGKTLKETIKDPVTNVKYERYGHFSDTKRYIVTKILSDLFETYKKSSRTARIMSAPE